MSDTQEKTHAQQSKSSPGSLIPYVGTIMCFAFQYEPRDWAICDGRSLPVAVYQDLYSVIKNTYGGDNVNFKLPDLRGRVMTSQGPCTTGTNYEIGQKAGKEQVTVGMENMPGHTHTAVARVPVNNTAGADVDDPTNAVFGVPATRGNMYGATPNKDGLMAPLIVTLSSAGSATPFPLATPYLALNYCIALYGIYPRPA